MVLMPATKHTDIEICQAILNEHRRTGVVRLVDLARHLGVSGSGLHGRLHRMAEAGIVYTSPVGFMVDASAFDLSQFNEGSTVLYWQLLDGALYMHQVDTDESPGSTRNA